MRFHPLVWLSISDYIQRSGNAAIGLYGTASSINTILDMPLKNDTINTVYLNKKLTQLSVTNPGFSLYGLVVKKGDLHSLTTETYLTQLTELNNDHINKDKIFYILEVDENDFISDETEKDVFAIGKFNSKLYKLNGSNPQGLVEEKLEFESLEPEKSAINSISTNYSEKDDLNSLQEVIKQKTQSLEALSLKIDVILKYLQAVNQGEIQGQQHLLNEIAFLTDMISFDNSEKSNVEKIFEEKEINSNFTALVSLTMENIYRSKAVVGDKSRSL